MVGVEFSAGDGSKIASHQLGQHSWWREMSTDVPLCGLSAFGALILWHYAEKSPIQLLCVIVETLGGGRGLNRPHGHPNFHVLLTEELEAWP